MTHSKIQIYDEYTVTKYYNIYRRQLYTITTLFIRDNHYFKLFDKSQTYNQFCGILGDCKFSTPWSFDKIIILYCNNNNTIIYCNNHKYFPRHAKRFNYKLIAAILQFIKRSIGETDFIIQTQMFRHMKTNNNNYILYYYIKIHIVWVYILAVHTNIIHCYQ